MGILKKKKTTPEQPDNAILENPDSLDSSSDEEAEENSSGSKKTPFADNATPSLGKKLCQFCQLEIPIKALRCYHCRSDQDLSTPGTKQPKKKVWASNRGFKFLMTDVYDEDDPEAGVVFTQVEVKIKDKELIRQLPSANVILCFEKEGKTAYCSGEALVIALPTLRSWWTNNKTGSIKSFMEALENLQKKMVKEIKKLLERKKIVYEGLWYLFEKGSQIYSWKDNNKLGATVTDCYMGHSQFQITGQMIKTDGSKFFFTTEPFIIPYFKNVANLQDLLIQMMDEQTMDELIERGQLFAQLGKGHHFKQYSGHLVKRGNIFTHKIVANGRVMIDTATFNRMNPNYIGFQYAAATSYNPSKIHALNNAQKTDPNSFDTIQPENLFMTWPTLPGFSFSSKKWGEFSVNRLVDIVFDDVAFDKLVLPEDKKALIKSLVQNNEENDKSFTDIITGKGGGCIFLLHGPPGSGKTLTAEAVSEHLHTPLYSISVGELGTTPHELESRLQEILEVAGVWKASILMDEADIFLERRSKSDITRNAMVGIFLRLLEYHQGVLFLTTNRIKAIDDAFSSRISVALHYKELDFIARSQVWRNLLESVDSKHPQKIKIADSLDYNVLCQFNLNGRQIRSTIRLSQALAKAEGVPMNLNHIQRTVGVALSFVDEFGIVKKKREEKKKRRNNLVPPFPPQATDSRTGDTISFVVMD